MRAKVTDFPDISSIIYEERESLAGIRSKYIEELRKTNCIHNHMYANKLEESKEISNPKNLKELEHEFFDFKDYMRKWSKKNQISLRIKYRQKDFIRFNDKIRAKIINGVSLDTIRDLLGFRIILSTSPKDSMDTIKLCYQVLNEVINFFVTQRHSIPLGAEPRSNSNFKKSKNLDIVIPEKSFVLEGFEENIKDYVMYPKENGYQSLHIVIRKPNGLTFEIQIRTFAMDILAEKGNAGHDLYAQNRREESDICLDYSKIHIPGFEYLPTGEVYDMIGLVKSIDPFNYL